MVLRIILKTKVIDEEPTVILSESMNALVVRLHPDKVSGYLLILESGSVKLPDNLSEILVGVGDFVDVEVLFFDVYSFMSYLLYSGFHLSVVKPKPMQLFWPITTDAGNPMNQSEPGSGETRVCKSRLVLVLLLTGS